MLEVHHPLGAAGHREAINPFEVRVPAAAEGAQGEGEGKEGEGAFQ